MAFQSGSGNSSSSKQKQTVEDDGVMSALKTVGVAVGVAAVALWGLSSLFGSSESSDEKMMKAPGKNYSIPRNDFGLGSLLWQMPQQGFSSVQFSSPYEFSSRDALPSLPRPLTSARLSNLAAEGSRLRVAYQGVRGAYSESAAEKAYPNCEAVPCEQFDTAFQAVEKWLVDRAVLPIENSLGGSIHRNYDLLLRHRLHIVGEVKLSIRHCLLASPGVKIENLKRVLSHPQALAQCENTLTKFGLVREAVDDTAGAAKHVALHGFYDVGAVASFGAAKIYGLDVLAQDIQDDTDNVTRFLMLAREPIIPGTDKPFKTSIVFSLEEGPGFLFKALAVFAMRNINLTKIESRPLPKQALQTSDDNTICFPKYFPYLFYVDFEASMADQRAQNALGHLKEFATFLRVLGSYPADNGLP